MNPQNEITAAKLPGETPQSDTPPRGRAFVVNGQLPLDCSRRLTSVRSARARLSDSTTDIKPIVRRSILAR